MQSLHQKIDHIVVSTFLDESPGNSERVDQIPPAIGAFAPVKPYLESVGIYPFTQRWHRIAAATNDLGPIAAFLQFVGNSLGLNLGTTQYRGIGPAY